jgi:pimeloyl-ACP methyl ester carboxylesterase
MKYFINTIGLFILIQLSISHSCFSQDTCSISINYGANSKDGKFAKVNGIRMYYETYGELNKQPLLLIHGNGGSIYSERCQIEHFKNKYYIIVADSRFHGKTENGNETLTYDLMAKDYNALLNFLKIDSVYIIGQSDGGIIGLILAMDYPNKVKKLVTTGPNLRPDTSALPAWAVEINRKDLSEVEMKINRGDTSKNLFRLRSQLDLMDKYPNINNDELVRIKIPVLVIAGDGDG